MRGFYKYFVSGLQLVHRVLCAVLGSLFLANGVAWSVCWRNIVEDFQLVNIEVLQYRDVLSCRLSSGQFKWPTRSDSRQDKFKQSLVGNTVLQIE
jgi:hypothetical protein